MDLKLQMEMPLEALVLRHSAAAAASSLWTWLAVLAAAFGLWRIRSVAVASKPDDPRRRPPSHPAQTQMKSPPPQPQAETPAPSTPTSTEARSPPSHVAVRDEGNYTSFTSKGTIFEARGWYEEGARGGDAVEEAGHESGEEQQEEHQWGAIDGGGGTCWGGRWRGDLGWYLHQDVAALNGRVVRLWEDERKLAASRLLRRRPQLAW